MKNEIMTNFMTLKLYFQTGEIGLRSVSFEESSRSREIEICGLLISFF